MTKAVPIDQILTDRVLRPEDADVSGLAKHIKDSGLKVPVLVDGNYQLIDGLRRIEALRTLGYTQVEATVVTLYPDACKALGRAMKHGVEARPMTSRRMWEIYKLLLPMLHYTKGVNMTGKRKMDPIPSAGGRQLFADTFGVNTSVIQAITELYRTSEEDPTSPRTIKAQGLIQLHEEGKIRIHGAIRRLKLKDRLNGSIIKRQDQLAVLDSAISSLRGTLRVLFDLGPIDPNSIDKFKKQYEELFKLRSNLYRFVRLLNEEIQKNVTD